MSTPLTRETYYLIAKKLSPELASHSEQIGGIKTDVVSNNSALTTVQNTVTNQGTTITGNGVSILAHETQITTAAATIASEIMRVDGTIANTSTNLNNIATNYGLALTNQATIVTNDAAITVNSGNITVNDADIGSHNTRILANVTNIATNLGSFNTLVPLIAGNSTDIGNLDISIDEVDIKVDDNSTDIATNAGAVITNNGLITDNATDITTNGNAIVTNSFVTTSLTNTVTADRGISYARDQFLIFAYGSSGYLQMSQAVAQYPTSDHLQFVSSSSNYSVMTSNGAGTINTTRLIDGIATDNIVLNTGSHAAYKVKVEIVDSLEIFTVQPVTIDGSNVQTVCLHLGPTNESIIYVDNTPTSVFFNIAKDSATTGNVIFKVLIYIERLN